MCTLTSDVEALALLPIQLQNTTQQAALREEVCCLWVRKTQALGWCEAENKEACLLVGSQVGVEHLIF